MFAQSQVPADVAQKIAGRFARQAEENFQPAFARVARAIWPVKTDCVLADIAGVSDRAARAWLTGQVAPPAIVVAAIVVAITFPTPATAASTERIPMFGDGQKAAGLCGLSPGRTVRPGESR